MSDQGGYVIYEDSSIKKKFQNCLTPKPINNSRKMSLDINSHSDKNCISDCNENTLQLTDNHLKMNKAHSVMDLSSNVDKRRKKKIKSKNDLSEYKYENIRKDSTEADSSYIEENNNYNSEKKTHKKSISDKPSPPLPRNGKSFVSQTYNMSVKKLYKSMFESDTFFEIVGRKQYDKFNNFKLTPWTPNEEDKLSRIMTYTFDKTIAFSRNTVSAHQTQVLSVYNDAYGIDTQTTSSGIMYSDYLRLDIHYRLTGLEENTSKLDVIIKIEFLKPCLLRSKIESETLSGLKKYYDTLVEELMPDNNTDSLTLSSTITSMDTLSSPDNNDKSQIIFQTSSSKKSSAARMSVNSKKTLLSHIEEKEEKGSLDCIKTKGNDDKDDDVILSLTTSNIWIFYAMLFLILTVLFIMTFGMFKLYSTIDTLSRSIRELEYKLENKR